MSETTTIADEPLAPLPADPPGTVRTFDGAPARAGDLVWWVGPTTLELRGVVIEVVVPGPDGFPRLRLAGLNQFASPWDCFSSEELARLSRKSRAEGQLRAAEERAAELRRVLAEEGAAPPDGDDHYLTLAGGFSEAMGKVLASVIAMRALPLMLIAQQQGPEGRRLVLPCGPGVSAELVLRETARAMARERRAAPTTTNGEGPAA